MDEPFLSRDASQLALTRDQLRSRAYRHPFHGVVIATGVPDVLLTRCKALNLVLASDAVFSHDTAAALWSLPQRLGTSTESRPQLHATVSAGMVPPDRRGVTGHGLWLPPHHVTEIHGLRLTTPARTYLDVAASYSLADLVALGDSALARGIVTREELAQAVNSAARRRGVVRARRGLSLLDGRSRSPMESRTRLIIVLAGLPTPVPNLDLLDVNGGWIATGDLVYPELRIVIEYDGEDHGNEHRRRADLRRRNLLVAAGYYVLHFSADDILRTPHRVVAQVRDAIELQRHRLSLAS